MNAPWPITVRACGIRRSARDGAGADVDLRPDARVAEIGKVADLGARTEIDVLDLDEVADLGLRPRDAPGRRRAKGPTVPPDATWAPSRWLNAWMITFSSITTPGPNTTFGSTTVSRPICVS